MMIQRAQLDLGTQAYRDIAAAIEAQRLDRLQSSFRWVEGYQRAFAQSFGIGSAFGSVTSILQQAAQAARIGQLSEFQRMAVSLQESLRQRTFTAPLDFGVALRSQLDALSLPKFAFPDFAARIGVDTAGFARAVESAIEVASSQLKVSGSSGLAHATARELQDSLDSAEAVEDVVTEVAAAVQRAATKQPKRIPWRYLLPMILAVVFFLIQWEQGEKTAAAIADVRRSVSSVSDSVTAGLEALRAVLGRKAIAQHRTWLQSSPWAHAPRIASLPEGALVTVLQRRRKWSLVLYEPTDGAPPAGGWVHQKYLRYAQSN